MWTNMSVSRDTEGAHATLSSSWKFGASPFGQLFRRTKNLFVFQTKDCFIINYLYQVYPKVGSTRKTCMFSLHFLKIKRYNVIFDLSNFSINIDQNGTFSLLTYVRLMQFSCTEIGNFTDDFMSLNKIHNFNTL